MAKKNRKRSSSSAHKRTTNRPDRMSVESTDEPQFSDETKKLDHQERLIKSMVNEMSDVSILEMVKDYALAFNRFGVRIDIESRRKDHRVVFSDGVADLLISYDGILREGMVNILKRFTTSHENQIRWESLFPELSPAELAAVTICEKPLITEALMNDRGERVKSPRDWVDGSNIPSVKKAIDDLQTVIRTKAGHPSYTPPKG